MNNGNLRNFIVWIILAFSLLGLYNLIDNPVVSKNQSEITFSQLLAEVDAGNVVDVEISGLSLQRLRKLKKHLDKLLGFEPTAAQVIDYMIQVHENVFENMNKKKRGGRK